MNDTLRAELRKAITREIGRDPQDNFEITGRNDETHEYTVVVTFSAMEKPLTVTITT